MNVKKKKNFRERRSLKNWAATVALYGMSLGARLSVSLANGRQGGVFQKPVSKL